MANQNVMTQDASFYEPVAVGKGSEGYSIDFVTEAGRHVMLRMTDTAAVQLAALVNACIVSPGTKAAKPRRRAQHAMA